MQYVRRKTKILQMSEVSSLQAPKNKETDTNVKYKYALTIARISQDDALEKTLKREKIMFEKRKSNVTSCRKSKKSKMYPPFFSKKRRKIPVYVKKKTDVIFGLAKFQPKFA